MSAALKVIGGAPPTDDNHCPECGADLGIDYRPGYGFAFGGGLGTYWTCVSDTCNWLYKELGANEVVA